MEALIAKWRRKATEDEEYYPAMANAIREFADEVEQAWHDHAHDAAWESGCPICKKEQMEEASAPVITDPAEIWRLLHG